MNRLKGIKIGFALCGSYCTYDKVIPAIQTLIDEGAEIFRLCQTMLQAPIQDLEKPKNIRKKLKMTGKNHNKHCRSRTFRSQ